jgi:hypothetical protein
MWQESQVPKYADVHFGHVPPTCCYRRACVYVSTRRCLNVCVLLGHYASVYMSVSDMKYRNASWKYVRSWRAGLRVPYGMSRFHDVGIGEFKRRFRQLLWVRNIHGKNISARKNNLIWGCVSLCVEVCVSVVVNLFVKTTWLCNNNSKAKLNIHTRGLGKSKLAWSQ